MFRTPNHTISISKCIRRRCEQKNQKKNDFIQCDLFNVVDEGCAREGDG